MEESLGPEWQDLLMETYMTCTIDEFDELWHDAVKELLNISMEETEDSDSEKEKELQDALLLRTLLLEMGALVSGLNLALSFWTFSFFQEEATLQYAQYKDRRAALFFDIINCNERVLHPYMSSRR